MNTIQLTKANNDKNGNPRVIVHFLAFLNSSEGFTVEDGYKLAHKRANAIGGKIYRGKDFGGGFIFQTNYSENSLKNKIFESRKLFV